MAVTEAYSSSLGDSLASTRMSFRASSNAQRDFRGAMSSSECGLVKSFLNHESVVFELPARSRQGQIEFSRRKIARVDFVGEKRTELSPCTRDECDLRMASVGNCRASSLREREGNRISWGKLSTRVAARPAEIEQVLEGRDIRSESADTAAGMAKHCADDVSDS
jgi:hypothetical protein